MNPKQPAVKSYFFGKGYRVLFNTISDAWTSNVISADKVMRKINLRRENPPKNMIMRWINRIITLFYWFQFFSIYFFGSIICAALSSIHMLVLFSFMLLIYFAFMIIWIIDRSYILFKGIFGACPKCKEKYTMPVYICKCGAEHTRLTPGVYGILKRRCQCGEKLPATFFNGRRFLTSKCPNCGNAILSKEAVPICVPVIGGPSVGKTCFITAVMHELINDVCPLENMNINFYDYRNQAECLNMVDKYKMGEVQTKTADINPSAFNFFISGKGIVPERLVYLYDIAGEAFGANDALSAQKQYEYCHGFVFLIDPLTISDFGAGLDNKAGMLRYSPSTADTGDTFDVFISNLKRISGLSANKLSKIPCAVVVNKIDAFDLEGKIGPAAAEKLVYERDKFKTIDDAMSFLTKEFLRGNGMNNFINNVDICFKNVRYFSCSALGHAKDGRGFSPVGVFRPFAWIVSNFDKRLARKFSRYINKTTKIKLPKKTVRLADGKVYRILSSSDVDDRRYFCLVECCPDGGIPDNAEISIYYGDMKNGAELCKADLTQNEQKSEEIKKMLEFEQWRTRVKFYLEHRAEPERS